MTDHADKTSLAAKRILLIRPQRQDDQLIAMLEDNGAEVTHRPVMTIQAFAESQEQESQKIKDQILELDNFHKAIVVSGNAAELSLEWIDKYWPMLPVGIDYFAVGERTAELLKQGGIDALHPSGRQNSEELLKLEQLQELENQRIIIFRGVGGREILGETLIERGARVELRGFGAFSVRHRKARPGRNPRNGEPVAVPEKHVPFFRTGKDLREKIDFSN